MGTWTNLLFILHRSSQMGNEDDFPPLPSTSLSRTKVVCRQRAQVLSVIPAYHAFQLSIDTHAVDLI